MSDGAIVRWLFGKMPVRGDFVSRGASRGMCDQLDAWLSQEMTMARSIAGEDFDTRYDRSPPWNFVDCDEAGNWSGGALCASSDLAGRRYPLIMAASAADARSAAALSIGCLNAMCEAFAARLDADGLMAAEVTPEAGNWHPDRPEWVLLADFGPALVLPGRFPQGAISTMLEMVQ